MAPCAIRVWHFGRAHRRRLNPASAGAALAVLVGLTTCAVASVSILLVPAYLALMVVIFVAPRGRGRSERDKQQVTRSSHTGDAELDQNARADQSEAVYQHHVAAPETDPDLGEWTADSAGLDLGAANSEAVRPRRGRVRGRKPARIGGEPALDSGAVTWIRIGPGKFVRADAHSQVADHVSASEDREPIVAGDKVGRADADLHGIAPAAASTATPATSPVADRDSVGSESTALPVAHTGPTANDETETSGPGLSHGGFWSQGRTLGRRASRVLRWIERAHRPAVRWSTPANAPPGPRPRVLTGARSRRMCADARQRTVPSGESLMFTAPCARGLRRSICQVLGGPPGLRSKNQHRVAVAVEAVTLANRFPVGSPQQVAACQGTDQHEQAGARQVEIGNQGIESAKLVSRPDKELSLAGIGLQARFASRGFERASRSRADRHNPSARLAPRPEFQSRLRRQFGPFRVHHVIFQPLDLNRPKCAHTDVKGHINPVDCSFRQPRKELIGKMESGGWRGDRAGVQ